jgi:hypothetical protein
VFENRRDLHRNHDRGIFPFGGELVRQGHHRGRLARLPGRVNYEIAQLVNDPPHFRQARCGR